MLIESTISEEPGLPVYIKATGAVSPQQDFETMMTAPANYQGDKLRCIEPDYTKYVDAKLIRRMSRIIKMGVAAASETLLQAGIKSPDAIITGTAYGCLADTDQFLTRMIEFEETLLSPTAFIQSTHNTVAAQIALMLQCHNYNNTYVHRGASFEAALTDAVSLLEEGEARNVLVGAADEITDKSHAILKRFGLYKTETESLLLTDSNTKGTMAGEGAAFFVLDKNKHGALARLTAFKNYYNPEMPATSLTEGFLKENNIPVEDIDLVITGNNGNSGENIHYSELIRNLFSKNKVITYKQYCGEYPTSISFALWMASHILKEKKFGEAAVTNILVYNNYLQRYPALYLLSAC
ncbi:beta-ketoacyl synthase N-terminal-like domain-containing protein [Niabella aquatica]